MLPNAPYNIRFFAALFFAVIFAILLRPITKKRLRKPRLNPCAQSGSIFFRLTALKKFEIHQVFLHFFALSDEKICCHPARPDLISVSLKKRKPIHALTAISIRLGALVFALWFLCMSILTVVTAQEMYDTFFEISRDYSDDVARYGLLYEFYDDDFSRYGYQHERPDFLEYVMLDVIARHTSSSYHTGGYYSYDYSAGEERSKLIRDISFPMETAVLFYDADGSLLHSSEDDIIYFDYYTQEEWDAGRDTTSGLHYGFIDISEGKNAANYQDDPYLRFRTMYANTRGLDDMAAIRVTGYFEGTRLVPVVMHYVTDGMVRQIVESDERFSTGPASYAYIVSDVDRTGRLDWQLQFDFSGRYKGEKLVTVYIEQPEMWDYQGDSVAYGGQEYENLAALTEAMDLPLQETWEKIGSGIFHLSELLALGRWTGSDFHSDTGESAIDFYMVTAIRANPLACAISALRNLYIVTGLVALVALLAVRGAVKKHLVRPVAEIANAMASGWQNVDQPDHAPTVWYEAEKLNSGFLAEQDRRWMKDSEITRLNTALEYAKTAEQNRRQMTSNIAHELKTPLAVIHSYAEGLKEHIAEEKRDQYIDVLLSEAERMDGMVLEMLDLSRLEAGKVKLSREDFSLISLTRAVFEKLEMAARAKNLRIEFSFPEEFTVTADEGRMAQVVENLATNAIKYTPVGGQIRVTIQRGRSVTSFRMENDSEPLSNEALRKVWDAFYRTDEARSGGGTGLGLAIAKNIVELHGGKCSVRNTKTGVEFGFVI